MLKMTENGLETQRGFENYNHEPEDEICPPKPKISSGNPFLVDFDKSPNHQENLHRHQIQNEDQPKQIAPEDGLSTGPGLPPPASNDVLIDFGTSEALPGPETGGGGKSNLELLGDFDPIQTSHSGNPDQDVPVSGSDDLKEFMDCGRGGNPDPVEVFSVPPPDPPDGQRRPEVDAVPEVNDTAPEVAAAAGSCDVIKAEEREKLGEVKNNDPKPPEATEVEKSEVDKNSEQKKKTKKEERKLPLHVKQPSPRSGSGSAEGGMAGKTAKSPPGETGISKPIKTAAKAQASAVPKPAIPSSLGSPRRTLSSSSSSKGQVDDGRKSVTNSKSNSQSDAKARGSSKTRSSSTSAEQPIKSPSPGSTPCSSVSASIDGRESRSTSAVRNARSKIGSLDNKKHTPGGGNVKIPTQKMDLSKVTSKCGSKDNMKHNPGGGQKKVESRKLEWKVESKVGSMDNAKHKPGGGDRKIENKKLEWNAASRVGSLDNAQHKAGGGDKKIETVKLDFKEKAESKIGSKDNIDHKAAGGTKKIETQKLNFDEAATSKVGSKDNIGHKPGGGDKKLTPENQGVTSK